MFALDFEGLLPVADEILADAEGACGLGDGVALLGDELDSLRLELGCVGASRFCHCWTSQGEYTPLTGCPPIVGKSKFFTGPTKPPPCAQSPDINLSDVMHSAVTTPVDSCVLIG